MSGVLLIILTEMIPHLAKCISHSCSMSSTATHFTKSFPKRAYITGLPKQAFHMQDSRKKYLQYILGGIAAIALRPLDQLPPVLRSNTSTRPRFTTILEGSQLA